MLSCCTEGCFGAGVITVNTIVNTIVVLVAPRVYHSHNGQISRFSVTTKSLRSTLILDGSCVGNCFF